MNEIQQLLNELMDAYSQIKRHVRENDKHLYERWKAGGFIVDEDVMSMYPNISQVVDSLDFPEEDQDDEI